MSDNIAIKVENVTKEFHLPHHKSNMLKHDIINVFKKKDKGKDIHRALKGVSFEVKQGEFFGILGRNGSGKSTMLKILSQIYTPTSGKVSHKGKLVPFIELGVGFKAELSGRENVYLNGALLGFSTEEMDKRYNEIVEFAELEEFMDQKLKNYSSGMKVRLAFAVAIQADADILLLDEVLAVGDAAFQRKCYNYFKSLKDNKKTIVFVTHNMSAAKEYCNRGILIEGGRITKVGEIDEVVDEYMNLFKEKETRKHPKKSQGRSGNGLVVVEKIAITQKDDSVVMAIDLKSSNETVKDVVLGLRIKDSDGYVLAGVSTRNAKGAKMLDFVPNEIKSVIFKMPNMFAKKEYTITTSVLLADGYTVCDVWSDAHIFKGTRSNIHYPIVCPAELIVNKG